MSNMHVDSVVMEFFFLFLLFQTKVYVVVCAVSAMQSPHWCGFLVRSPLWPPKGGCDKIKERCSGGLGLCGLLLCDKKCWTICCARMMQ